MDKAQREQELVASRAWCLPGGTEPGTGMDIRSSHVTPTGVQQWSMPGQVGACSNVPWVVLSHLCPEQRGSRAQLLLPLARPSVLGSGSMAGHMPRATKSKSVT